VVGLSQSLRGLSKKIRHWNQDASKFMIKLQKKIYPCMLHSIIVMKEHNALLLACKEGQGVVVVVGWIVGQYNHRMSAVRAYRG
jgi:hypothetical protein